MRLIITVAVLAAVAVVAAAPVPDVPGQKETLAKIMEALKKDSKVSMRTALAATTATVACLLRFLLLSPSASRQGLTRSWLAPRSRDAGAACLLGWSTAAPVA